MFSTSQADIISMNFHPYFLNTTLEIEIDELLRNNSLGKKCTPLANNITSYPLKAIANRY